MQRRDLIIGAGVLLIIVAIVLFIQNRQEDITPPLDTSPTPTSEERELDLEERFNRDIPENVEKADLEGPSGTGIATRDMQNGRATVSVLVDLPEPEAGRFYQAWVRSGEDTRFAGNLVQAKGGFLLDVNLTGENANFDEVIISSERVNDREIEDIVLRGSF